VRRKNSMPQFKKPNKMYRFMPVPAELQPVDRRSNRASLDRQMRAHKLLQKRLRGMSLFDIGQEETPSCSPQNIAQPIHEALANLPEQSLDHIRALEAARLDAMQAALWPQAELGDIAAIDRVLAIMKRRAALLGLDPQPGYFSREAGETSDGDQVVRTEIIGDPEVARVRWLEAERERLLGLTATVPPTGKLQ
jgi:hypothetical protein